MSRGQAYEWISQGQKTIANATPVGRDRDAVDIPAPATRQRVPQPPPLRLQPAERSSNLRPQTARPTRLRAARPDPATSVEHQRGHHQRQPPGQRGSAGGRGDRSERGGRHRRRAACGGAAQAPGLLTAREARLEHPDKLAAASDTSAPYRI